MIHMLDDYDYYDVPVHIRQGLDYYFVYGIPGGSFLDAVLKNDLVGAVLKADNLNSVKLTNIIRWLINTAPNGSYGSLQNVNDWIKDVDGHRSAYAKSIEHRHTIKLMKEPA